MTKDRNFYNFSICKLSENIISAYFSIRIQLRLNLHIAEVRSNIQNGKICLEIDYFSIILLYFFSFQKILLIGHPTYGTFFPNITCTNRSHKLAHDCIHVFWYYQQGTCHCKIQVLLPLTAMLFLVEWIFCFNNVCTSIPPCQVDWWFFMMISRYFGL